MKTKKWLLWSVSGFFVLILLAVGVWVFCPKEEKNQKKTETVSVWILKDESTYKEDGERYPQLSYTYEYDENGYLTERVADGGRDVFFYDKNGRLVKEESFAKKDAKEPYSYTEFAYDENGTLLTQIRYRGNGDQEVGYTYIYDDHGNLLEMTVLEVPGQTVEYNRKTFQYDENGQLTQSVVEFLRGELVLNAYTFRYDAEGCMVERESNGGAKTLYQYGANGNLTEVKEYDKAGELTGGQTYYYDEKGNLTKKESTSESGLSRWEYQYDQDGKLLEEHYWFYITSGETVSDLRTVYTWEEITLSKEQAYKTYRSVDTSYVDDTHRFDASFNPESEQKTNN